LAQVTVAGDVDISSLGGGPMIAAVLSGADLKVFGNNVNKMILIMSLMLWKRRKAYFLGMPKNNWLME
jgi:hypothetical protein